VQGLIDSPRNTLTEAQVLYLLESAPRQGNSFGADVLNFDLSVAGSMDLIGGSVKRSFLANIHGTCDLEFDVDFDYARGLVRPWIELEDAGLRARFYQGVYSLTTPLNEFGQTPRVRRVQGYDRIYLLSREIGDTWVAPSGAKVLDEVQRAITAAGLTGVALDSTLKDVVLPEAMIWPLVQGVGNTPVYDLTKRQQQTGLENATTWLRVINDLLFSIGYVGLYADPATGIYRSGPYVPPISRGVEHVFDFDDLLRTIVAQNRSRTDDTFKAPNVWVFVRQTMPGNPPAEPVAGNGLYTVDKSATDPRGIKYPQQIPLDVTSQAALVSMGDARVASDLRKQSKYNVSTACWPVAGHGDIYQYRDAEQGKDVKVQETSWVLPLNGDDMTREWTEVTA
jgi:hypothetical protein